MSPYRVKPSVLLVHGAFEDSSVWSGVIPQLDQRGLEATAVANRLDGLRRDAAYVASVAQAVDGPVLLAAQGYGGAVITVAADACPNVVALVYVAAFAPDVGESCVDLLGRSADPRPMAALQPAIVQRDDGPATVETTVRRDQFREMVAGDLPSAEASLLAARQRAVAAAALEEPAATAAWRRLPSAYVLATADRLIPPDVQRLMADRLGGEVIELDASHTVARTRAVPVAEVIAGAAERAGG